MNFKKTNSVTVLAFTTLAAMVTAASADEPRRADTGYYVGGEIGRSNTDLSSAQSPAPSLEKRDTSYGIHGGYQFNQYFGTELSLNALGKHKIGDTEAKTTVISLDAIGRLPVNDQFSLFGRLGVAHLDRDFKGLSTIDGGNSTGLKVGLGADYALDKNWSLRTEVTRYNNAPTAGLYDKTLDTWTVGVNYRF
ncbi:porin family protein [Roseateles koreensis]|uniref:Porin family protein n=1 Tax=Roseateles koreensis TaxID=2987526 RepID=A0ABT5KVX0_9BURK|nr:porin family protein [Roseateles koreensis]MDC8787084.1 porin family protein [Roseateles koreensis]